MKDQYGNPLHTTSQNAREAYVEAQTAFLQALPGVDAALDRAIAADDGFALAYVLKARNEQVYGRGSEARALIEQAMKLGQGITGQVRAQLEIFDHLIHGRVREGYAMARAHLLEYPRDAMVAQTSLGVYSLIGFSGQPGREAEHLAVAEAIATTSLGQHIGRIGHTFHSASDHDAVRARLDQIVSKHGGFHT